MKKVPESVKQAISTKIQYIDEDIDHLRRNADHFEREAEDYRDKLNGRIKERDELVRWLQDISAGE